MQAKHIACKPTLPGGLHYDLPISPQSIVIW